MCIGTETKLNMKNISMLLYLHKMMSLNIQGEKVEINIFLFYSIKPIPQPNTSVDSTTIK